MKRLLLRAKKSPFDVVSPVETLERNLIGTNSGNLLFTDAAYKLLATPDTTIDVHRRLPRARDAELINERYDAYVVPLANAFRSEFQSYLSNLTALITRLRIPVVILGVGAQAGARLDQTALRPIEDTVRAFASAVLDRSPSIGVRGEFSQDYLHSLGFRDVEVIGCPSMFLNGASMQVEKRAPHLDRQAPVAVNASPGVAAMGDLIAANLGRYAKMQFIAQDLETLAFLLWRDTGTRRATPEELPFDKQHPLMTQNAVRLFVDPWPWIDHLRSFAFSIGTRIHGNIAALLAGTPAYVLAHDSRTLELARYFAIPHRTIHGLSDIELGELYELADFDELNRGHALRFQRLVDFLHRHGLDHSFEHLQSVSRFDQRIGSLTFAAAVDVNTAAQLRGASSISPRWRWRLRRHVPRWLSDRRRAFRPQGPNRSTEVSTR